MTKDTVPQNYTLALALFDALPVILFGLASWLLWQMCGNLLVLTGGDRLFRSRNAEGTVEDHRCCQKKEYLAAVCADAYRDACRIYSDADRFSGRMHYKGYGAFPESALLSPADTFPDPHSTGYGCHDRMQFQAGSCGC